ncbi:transcription factor Adf-1-like [Vespula squamosa]|uniref:Transcription factor Adf-1-like n=1 Tax=Vespula squamosa TaxID=30214 RepID=A0ABD2BY50_VESSQ
MNTDELLIESVREYPFLYDVSDPGYHDNRKKDNAWQRISEKFNSSTVFFNGIWDSIFQIRLIISRHAIICRKRWIALRDSFRKVYKKRRNMSGEAAKQKRPWKYENIISFIIPHIGERNQITNLTFNFEESNDSVSQTVSLDDSDINISDIKKEMEIAPQIGLQQSNDQSQQTTLNKRKSLSNVTVRTPIEKDNDKGNAHLSIAQTLQDNFESKKNNSNEYGVQTDPLTAFFKAMEETVRTFSLPIQIEIKGKIAGLVNEYELKNYQMQQTTFKSPYSLHGQSSNWSHSTYSPDPYSSTSPPPNSPR